MKVTQEKLPASQIGLEIEITPEMSKKAYEKTLQEFTRSANIPGFRKGKVPRQVLIQRFGSTRLKAAVLEDLIDSSLKQAIEQEKIDALGNFQLRSSFEDLIDQFEPGHPLTFSAAVDVPPVVKLAQYKGLQVQAEEVKYDSERVEQVLENYRKQTATLVPIENRPAQLGDVAVVDFVGRLINEEATEGEEDGEQGEEIPGGSAEDFEIELAEDKFVPGFVTGIVGINSGETKDISVQFPDDYVQKDLAGKAATFTVTVKELKERELPELDDDFAQEVSDFETLAELQESLEKRFREEADEKLKANKEQALLKELVKHLEVDIPETLIKREVDFSITQTAMRLGEQGMDIRKTFTQDIVSILRDQARPEAIARIQRTLALGEVAKLESIKVEADEVEAKVQTILADYSGQDVDEEKLHQVIEEELLKDKIIAWLEENGTVELVPEGTLTPDPEVAIDADEETEDENIELDPTDATVDVSASTVSEATE
ncbi:trigger factor [Oculatella sp. LEGE 06141]|uniref:trigger factor n=1 Tax=Oculatella sp. LEGE 06141 TaxID=1828648 RepID=UPI001880F59E|nr:trigger factor [Oculatella sp. LEGE 06141]MBE9177717.1 trigger factor [Oculatella sp. LEGE 06141]